MKIRVLLSYEGTHFAGWQRQKHKRTVQGELEKALSELFQAQIPVFASGRTDQGVHALGQVAHFEISHLKLKKINLLKALNHLTGPDISLMGAWRAPKTFHARFSVEKKTYLFLISTQKSPPALGRNLLWWQPSGISIETLNEMSKILLGTQDFKSFMNTGSEISNTIRTIYEARWEEWNQGLKCFTITGSGFLRQMIRNLVGTQVALSKEPEAKKNLRHILESRNRRNSFAPAASKELYLKEIVYPPNLEKQCLKL